MKDIRLHMHIWLVNRKQSCKVLERGIPESLTNDYKTQEVIDQAHVEITTGKLEKENPFMRSCMV